MLRAFIIALAIGLFLCQPAPAGQPVARFKSVLGDFDVLLDSVAAPRSVGNFTAYANRRAYDSTVIHRSTTYNPAGIQIVQGGGFGLISNLIAPVPTDPPIPLEAGLPNSRGTLAMARGNDINSATSQWYFNVTTNRGLDFNYAVFGRVLGGGQSVIDAMGSVPVYDVSLQLGFPELPLLQPSLESESLVLIDSVRVETFAITNLARNGNNTELRWTALSTNTPVRIERTTDLAAGTWTTVATNLTTSTFNDTNAPIGSAFYRVVTDQ